MAAGGAGAEAAAEEGAGAGVGAGANNVNPSFSLPPEDAQGLLPLGSRPPRPPAWST